MDEEDDEMEEEDEEDEEDSDLEVVWPIGFEGEFSVL